VTKSVLSFASSVAQHLNAKDALELIGKPLAPHTIKDFICE
jgi:hypothetical protein